MIDILNTETGARLRAGLAVALSLVTFVVLVAQAALGALDVLPDWEQLGAVALFLQGLVSFLGRFTSIGDKI